MKARETTELLAGPAGAIETLIEAPDAPRGIALVAHPHPLFGGTHTNKVVHTLARTFVQAGYVALRPNFRGVGASEGSHDHGEGETEDLLAVIRQATARYGELPLVLAGFSFGAYVQTRVAATLAGQGTTTRGLVLVAVATGTIAGDRQYVARPVPADSLVIHGANDTTVPLANVLAWAEPQELPVVVVPGADHFFHRRLHTIRDIVGRYLPPLIECRR